MLFQLANSIMRHVSRESGFFQLQFIILRVTRSKSVELGEGKGEGAGRWNVSRSRNWLSFDILQAWIKFCSFLTVQLFWNVRDIHHIDQNYCRFTVISVLATSSLKIFRVYCSIALFIKCN